MKSQISAITQFIQRSNWFNLYDLTQKVAGSGLLESYKCRPMPYSMHEGIGQFIAPYEHCSSSSVYQSDHRVCWVSAIRPAGTPLNSWLRQIKDLKVGYPLHQRPGRMSRCKCRQKNRGKIYTSYTHSNNSIITADSSLKPTCHLQMKLGVKLGARWTRPDSLSAPLMADIT